MELNLKGKKALVTGGSKGIGKAIKEALEKEGVEVINWDREVGIDLLKEIPKVPEVDFIIHNIGGGGTWEYQYYKEVMQKNYGVMLDIMNKAPNTISRVIAIGSIFGKEAGHNPVFTASKAAMIAYMKSCSKIFTGVTYNCVSPGYINTKDLIKKEAEEKNIPLGTPQDIANAVVFLCSDKAKFINGENLTIDGAYSHAF